MGDRQLALDFLRPNILLQKTRKMKMLVSLIAVCLMVAVEGSFSTHNHMEYYPPGCPMNGRHSETHVMHRDNNYNGPFSPSYNGFYNDGFQSYMGSDCSPSSSRFGRMMRSMYSAGCGMQMNSMNRNFGNQFNGNQFSDNQCFGNQFNGNQFSGNQCFGNQYYGFPENFMSSYGQY